MKRKSVVTSTKIEPLSLDQKPEILKDNSASEGLMNDLIARVSQAISDADEVAAATRVAQLRDANLQASTAELVHILIQQKCWQTGAVGAVTAGAALVPGLGQLASLTFGVAADIGMTFKMQAELVLEIAAAYDQKLTPLEKRQITLLVIGISAGANKLLEQAGKQIAKKATEQLAQKSITKAIPFIGVAASAGVNIVTTYIVGQRADTYFRLGSNAMSDWSQSVRTITGIDEREIIDWLIGTTERSWNLIHNTLQSASGTVIIAGQLVGEVVVVGAEKVGDVVNGTSQNVIQGFSSTTHKVVKAGQWATTSITTTATATTASTIETSQWLGDYLATSAKNVTESIVTTGKRIGQEIVSGTSAAVETTNQAGQWVSSWFISSDTKAVSNTSQGQGEEGDR